LEWEQEQEQGRQERRTRRPQIGMRHDDCGSEISRSSSCSFCCFSSSSIVFLWSSWVLQSPLGFIWIRFSPWESPVEYSWIREAHKSKSVLKREA
jgi:hypothetical protein